MVSAKEDITYAAFEVIEEGAYVSLLTKFGRASVGVHGAFRLEDSKGSLLIESALLCSLEAGYLTMKLDALSLDENRLYYGAGAAAGAPLNAVSSTPRVGNQYGAGAHSWAPQYYSASDKYAALTVGPQDSSTTPDYWTHGKPDLSKYPANWSSTPGGVEWVLQGSSADLYLMPAKDLQAYRTAHSELTGAARVLPRYAFGFLAGRWGWSSQEYIEETLASFRDGAFPADAFISDFFFFTQFNDYDVPPSGSPRYHDFGYNNVSWPHPAQQLEKYHQDGFHFGGIRKPRLGNDQYIAHAAQQGWLLPAGLDNVNGEGRNMNFTSAEAREWYQKENQHYLDDGVDFWWNDEGEVMYFQFDGWNRAQLAGVALNNATRRFFTLNRAYTPGLQSLGVAVWTGDISVSWASLAQQPAYLLAYGLAGMPYVGCDTGGFVGGNTSSELLARWYWSSAFMSVMRVHSTMNYDSTGHGGGVPVTPHFPWLYGEEAARAMRKALEMRYTLIPMLYSLGHIAYATGDPIMRPLIMHFGEDPATAQITDQWLVGEGFMTAPVLAPQGQRTVYLPALPGKAGKAAWWYEFNTTTVHQAGSSIKVVAALDETPLYCAPGTLVPLGPVIQHTGQLPGRREGDAAQLVLQVYAGADGNFTLVEDDGESTAYEMGATRHTAFIWSEMNKTLSWSVLGEFRHPSMFVNMTINLFEPGQAFTSPTAELGADGIFHFQH